VKRVPVWIWTDVGSSFGEEGLVASCRGKEGVSVDGEGSKNPAFSRLERGHA
jgi:hypothetical protein